MQTDRYDIYTGFHKLLRSRLFEGSVRLGRTDFGRGGDQAEVLAFIRETLELFADHAAKEDAFLGRALLGYGGRLGLELDTAHAALEASMAELNRVAAEIAVDRGRERVRLGRELYARFNVFLADQVRHMAQEESEANAVLWNHLTDHELAAIHQSIIRSDTPKRAMWLLEQLLAVWSPAERARIRATAEALRSERTREA